MKIKNSNIVCILALLLLVACGAEDNLLESLLLPGEDAAGLERPEVVFVGPATGSTGVTLNTNIIITYSKAMDPILTQSALQLQAGGGATSAEPFWLSDRSVQYTVSPSLSAAKRYSITIVSSLARDTDGNYLAINYLSHFYTLGAGTAPQVTSANPGLESAIQFGWGLNQDPVINFSVPMDPQATGDAVTVSGGPARFIRQWSNNNTTLTLNMQDPLQANVTYTLKVASGAKSADGISITSPKTYLFHTGTDTVQPALNSVTSGTFVWPALVAYPTLNTITGVSKNSAFLFDFSEAMDPSSTIEAISFDPPIGGQFSWLTPTQLQFQPTNPLVTGATYRMAIESSATDAQGLTLPNRYLTDFTVDDPLDSVPITLVEVRGYTPGPDTADGSFGTAGTITGTPNPFTEYSFTRDNTACGNPGLYDYRIDFVFQTAGSQPLKTTGTGNVFDAFSVRYHSGHPSAGNPSFERIQYTPTGGLQIVRLRIACFSQNIRYLLRVIGGSGGLQDINGNPLTDNIDTIIYPVN